MRNVKKVIAGILLTATVLGTGTQLSVGAAKYSLERSSSEVSFNKRPSKEQNELDTDSDSYSVAVLLDKIHDREREELDDLYSSALFSYYIDSYKEHISTIDQCEEKWNEVANKCNGVLSNYDKSDERDEVKKYNLMKQIANATIAWFKAERMGSDINWENVASEFKKVKNSIEGTNEEICKSIDPWDNIQAQAKSDTAIAYALEVKNAAKSTDKDYSTVGRYLVSVALENYSLNKMYRGLVEECANKFEEVYDELEDMEQERQNSKLLAEFTFLENQLRLIRADDLLRQAEMPMYRSEKKINMLNEAGQTYYELYCYFMSIGEDEEASKCYKGLHTIDPERYK